MSTIRTKIPRTFGDAGDDLIVQRPCAACGGLTSILAETPFRPDIGEIPLHLTCATSLVQVKGILDRGEALTAGDVAALERLAGYVPPKIEEEAS